MGRRQEIQAQIAKLESQLTNLNRINPDTFPFGTIMVFAAEPQLKWHYIKVGEEQWAEIDNRKEVKELAAWILDAREVYGYFEVYEMRTQPQPFYASS